MRIPQLLNTKKIINDTAFQIFTKNGPIAFLPISKNETLIVYSINSLKKENHENVKNLINQYNKYNIRQIKKLIF